MVALLAAAVVACTSAALTLPATTMTGDGMDNNLGTGTTAALAVDPNASSSETAADSSTPESVAPAVEESAPQRAPETVEESEPVQDPETAEEPAGAPQDTNSDANAITVTDSQDTPSVLANNQSRSVKVGEKTSIRGSSSVYHQWSSDSGCVQLRNTDKQTVQVTGISAGTATLTHKYWTFDREIQYETFTVHVIEASSDTSTTESREESWQEFENRFQNPQYSDEVDFYVNLFSKIANSDTATGDTDASYFSQSVGTTWVTKHPDPVSYVYTSDSEYIIIQGNTNGSAYEVDQEIRDLDSSNKYGFIIGKIPSDEDVFQKIRNNWNYYTKGKGIEIDNQPVDSEDLTTAKYAIRWYVFKYSPSDHWHIDGILVPKYGRLTVSKTFNFGSNLSTAQTNELQDLLEDFTIDVTRNSQADGQSQSYALQMKKGTSSDPLEQPGYDDVVISSDAGTATYTWTVDVLNGTYTIKENGYKKIDGYSFNNATYTTKKSGGSQSDSENYNSDTGFTIECVTTPTDEPGAPSQGSDQPAQQSASITNNYTKNTGSLTIVKNIYGLTRQQVVGLVSGEYRTDGGLKFDVDYFNSKEDASSDNYEGETFIGDWTFSADQTLKQESENFVESGIWNGDIRNGEEDITEDEENGISHYSNSSLTEVTDNGETYYQYRITISDVNLNDWYHVWETHVDVSGYNLEASVSSTAENPDTAHNGRASVFQLTNNTTVTFTNKYTPIVFTVTKVDNVDSNKTLSGAEFYLKNNEGKYYSYEDQTKLTTWVEDEINATKLTSSENGTFTISGLPDDIYTLIEKKAPDGYQLPTENVTFTVSEGAIQSNSEGDSSEGTTITITNSTGVELPATGSIGTTPFATIGGPLFAVCAVGLGFGLRRRRGKEAK